MSLVILLCNLIFNSKIFQMQNMTEESKMLYVKLEENFKCQLCLSILDEPVSCIECQNTVCKSCLEGSHSKQCVKCKE